MICGADFSRGAVKERVSQDNIPGFLFIFLLLRHPAPNPPFPHPEPPLQFRAMFTGIVQECGKCLALSPAEGGAEFWIRASFAEDVELGESIAVNGACLTATAIDAERSALRFDLLAETLRLTNLGDLGEGESVNLERSLRIGDRLSGHFVQGHVDACVPVRAYEPSGQDHRLEVELPEAFAPLIAPKGSVCVNGISLTVAELGDESFTAWIIPHTHEETQLADMRLPARVNLEFDLLAKHLMRLTEAKEA